jgi:hypothetical protein
MRKSPGAGLFLSGADPFTRNRCCYLHKPTALPGPSR